MEIPPTLHDPIWIGLLSTAVAAFVRMTVVVASAVSGAMKLVVERAVKFFDALEAEVKGISTTLVKMETDIAAGARASEDVARQVQQSSEKIEAKFDKVEKALTTRDLPRSG